MAQTAQHKTFVTIENEAQRIFMLQRAACQREPYPAYEVRLELLGKVEKILIENTDAIADAINTDYGCRSKVETRILEVFGCVDALRDSKKKLRKWMKPQRRRVAMLYATGKNQVIPQPKGVVGIVSPWNYPLFLAVCPLANAIAAGNRCMIKLAANSSALCALLAQKFNEQISQDSVAILPGVKARDFSTLPFDHLCFTGSANAGREVMHSAADNLTPVTLELGGKSPTVICDDFDLETAAERLLFGKFINAGQTCLAPDYVFVPEAKRDQFVAAAQRIVRQRYPDPADGSYTSLIDGKAYTRIRAAMEDARSRGATVMPLLEGASCDDTMRRITPQLILDPNEEMIVMQEEIFGPLLPVKTYKTLDEVIDYINSKDRPLGLYFFSNDERVKEKILYNTISGGVTINNCVYHVTQHDMPFGGIGASGMGHYHGYEGFLEFSKLRSVFTQPKISALHLLYPPYTKFHSRMYELMIRFVR